MPRIDAEELINWLLSRQKHYEDFSPKKAKAMAEVRAEVRRMAREAEQDAPDEL